MKNTLILPLMLTLHHRELLAIPTQVPHQQSGNGHGLGLGAVVTCGPDVVDRNLPYSVSMLDTYEFR